MVMISDFGLGISDWGFRIEGQRNSITESYEKKLKLFILQEISSL